MRWKRKKFYCLKKKKDLLFRLAKKEKFAKKGDRVIITAGVPFGHSGATNVLRIASVDRY